MGYAHEFSKYSAHREDDSLLQEIRTSHVTQVMVPISRHLFNINLVNAKLYSIGKGLTPWLKQCQDRNADSEVAVLDFAPPVLRRFADSLSS
jgi:hypothetical protein